jgi:hypothetical protein
LLKTIDPSLDLAIIKDIEARPENLDTEPLNFSLDDAMATPSSTKK